MKKLRINCPDIKPEQLFRGATITLCSIVERRNRESNGVRKNHALTKG